jgi:hypothetical protein
MKPEDHVLYVATLLELVQRMEQTLKCKIRCNLDSKSDLNWTPNPV